MDVSKRFQKNTKRQWPKARKAALAFKRAALSFWATIVWALKWAAVATFSVVAAEALLLMSRGNALWATVTFSAFAVPFVAFPNMFLFSFLLVPAANSGSSQNAIWWKWLRGYQQRYAAAFNWRLPRWVAHAHALLMAAVFAIGIFFMVGGRVLVGFPLLLAYSFIGTAFTAVLWVGRMTLEEKEHATSWKTVARCASVIERTSSSTTFYG